MSRELYYYNICKLAYKLKFKKFKTCFTFSRISNKLFLLSTRGVLSRLISVFQSYFLEKIVLLHCIFISPLPHLNCFSLHCTCTIFLKYFCMSGILPNCFPDLNWHSKLCFPPYSQEFQKRCVL